MNDVLLLAVLQSLDAGDVDTARGLADLAGDDAAIETLLADDVAESVQGPKGPPPFEGAVFDTGRHRWVKGTQDETQKNGDDMEPWQDGNDLHPEHPINRTLPTKFETDQDFDTVGQFYDDMDTVVDGWMRDGAGHLDAAKAEHYGDVLKATFKSLPIHMSQAAAKGISRVKAHADIDAITAEAGKMGSKAAKAGKKVLGMFSSAPGYPVGHLHIDGGKDNDDMKGTYSHELGHAVDVGYKHSNTNEWRAAFADEIGKDPAPLSEYATTSPQEGFAEYVRLIADQPAVARKEYPKCWAFLKTQGLV